MQVAILVQLESVSMRTYEEGFADGQKHALKNTVSMESIYDSIDKFLDKINLLKRLLNEIKTFLTTDYKSKTAKEEILQKINNVLNNNEEENAKTSGKQKQVGE
jgi:hypothetical protein